MPGVQTSCCCRSSSAPSSFLNNAGIYSAGETFVSNSLASAALFVFHKDPSAFASAQGRGLSGWARASLMCSCLLWATRIMSPNKFISTFRTTSLAVPLPLAFFALTLENVFKFCFVVLSWNFVVGGASSKSFFLNIWYASYLTWWAPRRFLATSVGATVPVDRLKFSLFRTNWIQAAILHQVNQELNICLVFPDAGPLEIWMSQLGTT